MSVTNTSTELSLRGSAVASQWKTSDRLTILLHTHVQCIHLQYTVEKALKCTVIVAILKLNTVIIMVICFTLSSKTCFTFKVITSSPEPTYQEIKLVKLVMLPAIARPWNNFEQTILSHIPVAYWETLVPAEWRWRSGDQSYMGHVTHSVVLWPLVVHRETHIVSCAVW